MTTHRAPFAVQQRWSDTTVVDVEASGTATFAGQMRFVSEILASASARFELDVDVSGRVKVGGDNVILAQRVTIDSTHSTGARLSVSLPPNADLIDFLVDVEIPFAAGALATAAEIEASIVASAALLLVVPVSATGRYNALDDPSSILNIAQLRNIQTTIEIYQSTQSLASAMTVGQAIITIRYVKN